MDSVHLRDSPLLGTTDEEPGFAAAGAPFARLFNGEFPGDPVGRCWARTRPICRGDLQTDGRRKEEHTRWQKRDLSAHHYVYCWADCVHQQARMQEYSDCMLVLLGATPEGKEELIGFQVGDGKAARAGAIYGSS